MTEVFGRLAPGTTLDQARAELRTVYSTMKKDHPEAYSKQADFQIEARMFRDEITSGARDVLLVLLAASALVFVIACCNVANLILARTVRREGELAVRMALGASRGALRRMLLAGSAGLQFSADGHVHSPGEEDPRASWRTISPGYFAALGVPIVAGRDFNALDGENNGDPVVIVSQTLAQRMFPNQDPINRHVFWTDPRIAILSWN